VDWAFPDFSGLFSTGTTSGRPEPLPIVSHLSGKRKQPETAESVRGLAPSQFGIGFKTILEDSDLTCPDSMSSPFASGGSFMTRKYCHGS